VKAPIDEVDLPRIDIGKPVEVSCQSFPDRVFHGAVKEIDPAVTLTQDVNRTGEVEVELEDAPQPPKDGAYPPGQAAVRVGMSADIEVIVKSRPDALRIPAYAVHEDDSGHSVYVVAGDDLAAEPGKIERRAIKIGYSNWDYVEVTDGLSPGAPVVVTLDVEGLKVGARAKIVGEVTQVQAQ
jgi:HlyD family secretion protein